MPTAPHVFRPAGSVDTEVARRRYDTERRKAKPWRGWYSLAVWRKARAVCFARQPLCERCLNRGKITLATVVNHRIPHRGAWALFVDPSNHESVCAPCHDSFIQAEEAEMNLRNGLGRGGCNL